MDDNINFTPEQLVAIGHVHVTNREAMEEVFRALKRSNKKDLAIQVAGVSVVAVVVALSATMLKQFVSGEAHESVAWKKIYLRKMIEDEKNKND
jgi:hypothetical protein